MILSFSEAPGYTFHGAAPATASPIKNPVSAAWSASNPTSRSTWGSNSSDSYYFPPTVVETPSLIFSSWTVDLLGIICICHTSVEIPLLVMWGERQGAGKEETWCKVFPARNINEEETIHPSNLPAHLIQSDEYCRLLQECIEVESTATITHTAEPFLEHGVSVTKTEWLGMPLFEIKVTLNDLRSN